MKRNNIIIALILSLLLLFSSCDVGLNQNEESSTRNPEQTCNHEDANDDGKCDICNDSVIVSIDFYAINDLHGKFSDTDSNIGVDELTTYLKAMAEIDDNVVFLKRRYVAGQFGIKSHQRNDHYRVDESSRFCIYDSRQSRIRLGRGIY